MQQEPEREPLVDRTLEVQLLRDRLGGVVRGEPGHAVLLLGESGVGKSRLAAVALDVADELRMRTLSAQCLGSGAEPLLPLKEALAAQLGRTPERIRRTLVGSSPRLLESVPFVGAFLASVGTGLGDRGAFESAGLHGVYEELARVLLGMAEKQGLCLVVEDLHAADQDTLYFLHYFLRKVRHHRVVVVLTAQEEQLGRLPHLADLVAQWTVEGCAVLTVLPLERAHVGEYVHQVAALGRPVDDRVVDELFRLTVATRSSCGRRCAWWPTPMPPPAPRRRRARRRAWRGGPTCPAGSTSGRRSRCRPGPTSSSNAGCRGRRARPGGSSTPPPSSWSPARGSIPSRRLPSSTCLLRWQPSTMHASCASCARDPAGRSASPTT